MSTLTCCGQPSTRVLVCGRPFHKFLSSASVEIYEDSGWDISASTNRRLDSEANRNAAFPTLTDLVTKVEVVVGRLGYEERIAADIRAALRTRLNSLRTGAKGRMLDVRRSLPMNLIFRRATILELEAVGDDDDKAFLMGLIVDVDVWPRNAGLMASGGNVLRLVVIEEAHRLLASSAPRLDEADARGKAVETFVNLISEVRAYGQGVSGRPGTFPARAGRHQEHQPKTRSPRRCGR